MKVRSILLTMIGATDGSWKTSLTSVALLGSKMINRASVLEVTKI